MKMITDKQISEMIALYKNNAESLQELEEALDNGLEVEDGIEDSSDSFEQGFNNALEKVFEILDIKIEAVEDEPLGDISLYDYLRKEENDFDTMDADYSPIITTCYIDEEHDEYEKFCNAIYKLVKVEERIVDPDGSVCLIVTWEDLIKRNKEAFVKFMEKFWVYSYYEEQTFIHEWLSELHQYFAGNVSTSVYKELLKLVERLN